MTNQVNTDMERTDGSAQSNRSAIVIDDQEFVCRLVSQMLSNMDFEPVMQASDGRMALDMLREVTPSIIICDVVMKPMDGLSFLQVLREKYPQFDQVPIIFLTNNAASETVLQAMALGASGFLVKPVSPRQLQEQIDKALGQQINRP